MKRYVIIILVLLTLSPAGTAPGDSLSLYMSRCRYDDAFRECLARLSAENDPGEREYLLYMLEGILAYIPPSAAIPGLEKLRAGSPFTDVPSAGHLDHMMNLQYLRIGDITSADRIRRSMGFLALEASGPFNRSAGDTAGGDAPSTGKYPGLRPFTAVPDRQGIISMDGCAGVRDSRFILNGTFTVPSDGTYLMFIGAAAGIDLSVDGTAMLRDPTCRRFHHDQFMVTLKLTAGSHRIRIVADDREGTITLSLRLTGADGRPVDAPGNGPQGNVISSSTTVLPRLISMTDSVGIDPCRAAFLMVASGRDHDDRKRILELLGGISPSSPAYADGRVLAARMEDEPSQKGDDLSAALSADAGHLQAAYDLFYMYLDTGFLLKAYDLLQVFDQRRDDRRHLLFLRGQLFLKKGWHTEALKDTAELGELDGGLADRLSAMIYGDMEDHIRAARSLGRSLAHDRYDPESIIMYADQLHLSGGTERAIAGLYRAVALFPSSVVMRLKLAELLEGTDMTSQAVTVLASTLRLFPFNAQVHEAMGRLLVRRGNTDAGIRYCRRSLELSPGNFPLRQYLSLVDPQPDETSGFRVTRDASLLAGRDMPLKGNRVLLDETVIRIDADGSSERSVRQVYHVENPEGAGFLSSLSVPVDPGTDTLENMVCSITSKGETHRITDCHMEPLSDPDSRLYYSTMAAVISLPALSAGTVVDFRYTLKRTRSGAASGVFTGRFERTSPWPTDRLNIIASLPEGFPVHSHLRNADPSALERVKRGGRDILRLDIRDLPALREETAMPPREELMEALYLSTFGNMEEFGAWYRSLTRGRAVMNDAMTGDLESLLNPAMPPAEKADRIYRHVTDRTRYVGFELGMGGIRPRPAAETYRTAMGDCKDTALLLVTMLRHAGIPADMALVRTRDRGRGDYTVPHTGEFNHAIVRIPAGPGFPAPVFLDGTARGGGINDLPANDRGIPALVIGESKILMTTTAESDLSPNTQRVTTRITLTSDGAAVMLRRVEKQGPGALEALSAMEDSQERTRTLQEYWGGHYPGATVSHVELSGDGGMAYTYRVNIPSFASVVDGVMLIPPFPVPGASFRSMNTAGERHHPVELDGPSVTLESAEYVLPRGYCITEMPAGGNYRQGSFSAEFKYGLSDGIFTSTSGIFMNAWRVEPADYPAFRDFTRFVVNEENRRVVLVRKN